MTTRTLGTGLAVICSLLLAGCTEDGMSSFGDNLSDPQLPPRGSADLPEWIAAGHYQAWRCEPVRHAGRSPSPHGTNRICSNDALHAATGRGDFPVGAASVKEIFDGDRISAYAVSRRTTTSTGGESWYWYEGNQGNAAANGQNLDGCTGCHGRAERDFVFTVVSVSEGATGSAR
jgi:hypothetical protein